MASFPRSRHSPSLLPNARDVLLPAGRLALGSPGTVIPPDRGRRCRKAPASGAVVWQVLHHQYDDAGLNAARGSGRITPMIYLDNAATSFPKPESVYQALDRFARTTLANPGRAGHKMALAAEHALDDARHRLNQFFNGRRPERCIFTLNCTDALNMAFKGVLNDGDHVITTDLEHNSVWRPLVAMAEAGRITLTRVAADAGGTVDPGAIAAAITPKTRLVAVTHASNVLGTVQPIAEIGSSFASRDALFLVDAAQTAGVIPHRRAGRVHRPAWRSPATSRCSARPGPARSTSDRARTSARGARAAPAATRPARRSRRSSPTSSKAARRTCSASRASLPVWISSKSGDSTRSTSTRSSCATSCGQHLPRCPASRSSATPTRRVASARSASAAR